MQNITIRVTINGDSYYTDSEEGSVILPNKPCGDNIENILKSLSVELYQKVSMKLDKRERENKI